MTFSDRRTPRDEMIDAAMAKLAPHIDMRCGSCGGTGTAIRSNLDCTPCDATGIQPGLDKYARASVTELVDAMIARHMLHSFRENAVIQAAVRLCQDSLGDDVLWTATTPLRKALADWNGGVPPHAAMDDESLGIADAGHQEC